MSGATPCRCIASDTFRATSGYSPFSHALIKELYVTLAHPVDFLNCWAGNPNNPQEGGSVGHYALQNHGLEQLHGPFGLHALLASAHEGVVCNRVGNHASLLHGMKPP